METRKVQQVGGGTYTVSLPREWADDCGVEAGAPVYLYTHLDGSLVVRRRERDDSDLASTTTTVEGASPAVAGRQLRAAYTAGFERITLTAADEFTSEQRRVIGETARSFTGAEVAAESDDRITVRVLLDADDISIQQSVLQLRFNAVSMQEAAVGMLADADADAAQVERRDDQVDRVFALIARHFNRSQSDLEEIDKLGIDRRTLFRYYSVARQLERVADHAVEVARVADGVDDSLPPALVDDVVALAADARQLVADASDVVVNGSGTDRANATLDERDRVVERGRELARSVDEESPEVASPLTRTLHSITRTAEIAGNVAEVALAGALLS